MQASGRENRNDGIAPTALRVGAEHPPYDALRAENRDGRVLPSIFRVGAEHPPYWSTRPTACLLEKRPYTGVMSWYRRWRKPGSLYFFTAVTYQRRPIFSDPAARKQLRQAILDTMAERPWDIPAIVLLPDHLHCLWQLPSGDEDYSTRWRLIKSRFTGRLLGLGNREPRTTDSRQTRREHGVWQRRYWEHLIRDETDWKQHLDYIHYNPVRHGLAAAPKDWPYSTFMKYVRLGEYAADWGFTEPVTLVGWSPPE